MTQTSGETTAASKRSAKGGSSPATRATGSSLAPANIARFIREVVAELRKVIWPTRKELVTYTIVVVFFVAVITAIVGGLDFGFAKAALAVFGRGGQ